MVENRQKLDIAVGSALRASGQPSSMGRVKCSTFWILKIEIGWVDCSSACLAEALWAATTFMKNVGSTLVVGSIDAFSPISCA